MSLKWVSNESQMCLKWVSELNGTNSEETEKKWRNGQLDLHISRVFNFSRDARKIDPFLARNCEKCEKQFVL